MQFSLFVYTRKLNYKIKNYMEISDISKYSYIFCLISLIIHFFKGLRFSQFRVFFTVKNVILKMTLYQHFITPSPTHTCIKLRNMLFCKLILMCTFVCITINVTDWIIVVLCSLILNNGNLFVAQFKASWNFIWIGEQICCKICSYIM